jgi:hexosaminidase
MEKVYSYEPTPAELDESEQKYILGAQGNVWTEYISTTEKVEYMAVPRMCALAEVDWTPYELRDYEKFLYRMGMHYQRLDAMNVNYRIPPPVAENESVVFLKEQDIVLRKSMDGTDIRYTTDGSEPDENSRVYTGPLTFTEDAVLKARTVMPSGKSSVSLTITLDKQVPEPGLSLDMPVNGLSYSLFTGSFRTVSQLVSLKPDNIGEIDGFIFPENITQERFGLIFNGYINIDTSGVYRFYARSDDGSVLYINGRNIVNNDGLHAPQLRSGEIALGEGWHRIRLEYFQAGGGKSLDVYWSGPGFENMEINKEELASMHTMLPMTPGR